MWQLSLICRLPLEVWWPWQITFFRITDRPKLFKNTHILSVCLMRACERTSDICGWGNWDWGTHHLPHLADCCWLGELSKTFGVRQLIIGRSSAVVCYCGTLARFISSPIQSVWFLPKTKAHLPRRDGRENRENLQSRRGGGHGVP